MEIQDYLRQALHEKDSNKQMQHLLQCCKKLSSLLPFPAILEQLASRQLTMKYLLIGSEYFEGNLQLLYRALQERYYDCNVFLKLYFDAITKIMIDQEQYVPDVHQNQPKLYQFLLTNTKSLIKQFFGENSHEKSIAQKVNAFYKLFIKYNMEYELLNQCFSDALEIRELYPILKELDPNFEQDVEDQLVALTAMSMKNVDAPLQKSALDPPKSARNLSKKEMKLQMIEDWLFTPCEVPLLSAEKVLDQLGSDTFKSKFALDAILSFILLPNKHESKSAYKISNIQVDINPPNGPSFRQYKVQVDPEKRPLMQFRAFRAMQALSDNRNHFLITQVNKDYYIKAYQMLYECLKYDLIAITLCPEIVIQYLTFLLYQESDVSVYFLLYYNIPFRLMLFLDIPAVSQYMGQLMKFYRTPYHKLPQDQSELLWKYFEITHFFQDLMQFTVFDNKTILNVIEQKCSEHYKPDGVHSLLTKPELTPLEHEKFTQQVEFKRIAEEIENIPYDIDEIVQLVQGKTLKAVKLFQRMIDNSNLQQQIQERKQAKKRFTLGIPQKHLSIQEHQHSMPLSPMRRRTVMAPKLQLLLEGNNIKETSLPTPPTIERGKNLFSILESTIQTVTLPTQPDIDKPVYQRLLKRQPSKLMKIHNRSFSNRNERLSSQNLIPSSTNLKTSMSSRSTAHLVLNRFTHLSGSICQSSISQDFQLYPPELKNLQQEDLEKSVFDPNFEHLCQINEEYTKGAFALIYEVIQNVTSKLLVDVGQIMQLRTKWQIMTNNMDQFMDIVRKNYLLKQKVTQDYDSTYIIAGRIYNILLTKNMIINHTFVGLDKDLNLLIKILFNVMLQNKVKFRTILLLESLTLILENTKQKLLLQVPTTFWHLLLEQYAAYQYNKTFQNYFTHILKIAFTYGSQIIFSRLILKVNCLTYLQEYKDQVRPIVISIYSALKGRSHELKIINSQISFLSSWRVLETYHQKELQQIYYNEPKSKRVINK